MTALIMAGGKKAAAWSPVTAAATCLSWHRADLGVTTATGGVSVWADQSGNGRTYEQTVSAKRPATGGTLGGQASLIFTAANSDHLALTGTSYGSPSALHVIRVCSIAADPPAGSPAGGLDGFGAFAGAQIEYPYTSGDIYDSTGANSRVNAGNPSTSLTTDHVYETVSTASAFKCYVNGGTALYSGASLGVGVRAVPEIGGDTRSVRYLDGELAEIMVFSSELGAGDRTGLSAYMLARYGITIT
jgi:hypothetical protein